MTGEVISAFNHTFRDDVTDGVPASGINPPSKAEARALGGVIEGLVGNVTAAIAGAGGAAKIIRSIGNRTTAVATGIQDSFRMPSGMQLTEVRASVDSAAPSSSGNITISLAAGGVSFLSSPLQIDQGNVTSVGSASPSAISNAEIDDNVEITANITGAGTGAKGLSYYLIGAWAAFGVGAVPYYVTKATPTASVGGAPGADTLNIVYPGGLQAGDIAILQVNHQVIDPVGNVFHTPSNILRPSGWTAIVNPLDEGNMRTALFWKRLSGTESGNQPVSCDNASFSTILAAAMSIWRGCVGAGTPYEGLAQNAGSGVAMTGAIIVTLGPNRRAVDLFTIEDFAASSAASGPDTGWTNVFDDDANYAGGERDHFACSAQAVPVAASIAAETRTMGASHEWTAVSLALVPGT